MKPKRRIDALNLVFGAAGVAFFFLSMGLPAWVGTP